VLRTLAYRQAASVVRGSGLCGRAPQRCLLRVRRKPPAAADLRRAAGGVQGRPLGSADAPDVQVSRLRPTPRTAGFGTLASAFQPGMTLALNPSRPDFTGRCHASQCDNRFLLAVERTGATSVRIELRDGETSQPLPIRIDPVTSSQVYMMCTLRDGASRECTTTSTELQR
jgi:hypothetical protein